jgi:hypothetical protein
MIRKWAQALLLSCTRVHAVHFPSNKATRTPSSPIAPSSARRSFFCEKTKDSQNAPSAYPMQHTLFALQA